MRSLVIVLYGILFMPLFAYGQEPSFDDQFVSSTEYTKLMDRLYNIEKFVNEQTEEIFWDDVEQWAIISSGFAALGALIILVIQTRYLKREQEFTFRPLIGQSEEGLKITRYFAVDGTIYQNNEYNALSLVEKNKITINAVEWNIFVENFGKAPALVSLRFKVVIGRIPKKEEISGEFGNPFVVMPRAKHEVIYIVSPKDTNDLIDDKTISCIMFEFKYSYLSSKKEYRYGFTAQTSSGKYWIKDTWDEKTFKIK